MKTRIFTKSIDLHCRHMAPLLAFLALAIQAPAGESAADATTEPADLAWLAEAVDDGALVSALGAQLRGADAAERLALEKQLLAVATDAKATHEGRRAACRLLAGFASGAAVPALAPLLTDESLTHSARVVLETAPGTAVDDALIQAMEHTTGATRLGLIDSLAIRRSTKAVRPLAKRAGDRDEVLAAAAMRALGAIGDRAAFKALGSLRTAAALLAVRAEAQLVAASHLIEAGTTPAELLVALDRLTAVTQPLSIRAAAWRLKLRAQPDKRVQMLGELFAAKETALHAIAARSLDLLADDAACQKLIGRAGAFPPESIEFLVQGLAARGSRSVLPFVRRQLSAADEFSRLSALRALGRVGEVDDLPMLLELARAGAPIGSAARDAIVLLPDRRVDPSLLQQFEATDSPVRALVTGLLADRGHTAAVPALVKAAPDAGPALMPEIYKAVGALADGSVVPKLLARWGAAPAAEQGALERAIVAIGRRVVTGTVAGQLAARLSADSSAVKVSTIRMLGAIGDAASLALLEPFLDGEKPEENAFRALIAWRTAEAMPVLQRLVGRTDLPEPTRVGAWKAMLRLAGVTYEDRRQEGSRAFQECMSAAFRTEDRVAVIAAVEKLEGSQVTALLRGWVLRPDVSKEAVAALERVLARDQE